MTTDLEQPLINTKYPITQENNSKIGEDGGIKLEKSYFEIMGLCCSSEVPLIEGILKPLDGVKEISVVVPTKTLMVLHDTSTISPSQIVKALNQARLEASVRPRGDNNYTKKWPGKWDIACGLLLALSFLKYVYHPMQWLAIVAVLIGIPNIIWRSIASIRNLTLNVNIIVLISVGGTLALQDYTDAAIIVFLYNIAQWLESRASYKAMSVMSSLTSMTPLKATLAETGKQVDVTTVDLGTIIAVKAGEVIPIDGEVMEGKCEVDEKALTGESFPVVKDIGSTVWAGTINLNGYVSIRTTKLAENCLVARMVNLVEEAQSRKAKIQTFIDNCAKWYIPAVVLISASIAVSPIIFQIGDRTRWFQLALVVLVSACPCALVISTPVTVFCALSKAATTGLLFKGGDYLELLAKVKTVAFDKTGTITTGDFVVTHFQSLHDTISVENLIFWVSSIESKSSHPMAAALINYATSCSIEPKPELVEEFQNFPGEGIYGKIEGAHVYIGNYRISLRAGCKETSENELRKLEGKGSGFIYMGATLVGTFDLSDNCRSGAMEAIKELKESGIRTVMLTGDNHVAAQHVQYQMRQALDIVHSSLLPEDKAEIIKDLKKDGVVAMVGDGINDALALATTDIGISMGISGSALAMETGHVILMSNDIRKIPQAIQISKKASRKIIENVIISFSTKGLVLALAIAGYSMLLVAVVTDVGTCLLVILNSMLLLRGTEESKKSTSSVKSKACCEKTYEGEVKCQSSVSKEVFKNKACCEKTCEGEVKCKSSVGKEVIKNKGCCEKGEVKCQSSVSKEVIKNKGCCEKGEVKCQSSVSKEVIKNKACCEKTCKGEVKCQSSVSSNLKKAEPKKGCCNGNRSCKAKLEGSMEKKDCEILAENSVIIDIGCCKRASNCRNEKCRSSSGCAQSGTTSDVIA